VAALLFPLDVAARRLRITRADAQRFMFWARTPATQRRAPQAPRALDGLFAARGRAARGRRAPLRRSDAPTAAVTPAKGSSRIDSPSVSPAQKHAPEIQPETTASPPSAPSSASPEDLTERLKQAKKRARR
jgi:hypothetical protein